MRRVPLSETCRLGDGGVVKSKSLREATVSKITMGSVWEAVDVSCLLSVDVATECDSG